MRNIYVFVYIITALFFCGCKKQDDTNNNSAAKAASLQTATVTGITSTSAVSGGNITSEGGSAVTQRGVCWNTTTNPTVQNGRTSEGTGTGNFTSTLAGLTANTTYYIRAYAINATDTAYGNELSFKTGVVQLPTITTNAASNVKQLSAQSGGNITSDGGAAVTTRGVCWSTTANPTTADNKAAAGSGAGSYTATLISLSPNTTYYTRAYATNSIGTAYGTQISLTTQNLSIAGAGVTDIDGNKYATVILGDKEWMAENLRTAHFKNGEAIPNVITAADWQNTANAATPAWCYYNNTAGYNNTYGKLYNSYAVTDPRQACPTGWHAPSSGEWTVLSAYLGGFNDAGGLLKEAGASNWVSPNTGATNASGFNALPGGNRAYYFGNFSDFGVKGTWWTTNQGNAAILFYNNTTVSIIGYAQSNTGYSVRCVKD